MYETNYNRKIRGNYPDKQLKKNKDFSELQISKLKNNKFYAHPILMLH